MIQDGLSVMVSTNWIDGKYNLFTLQHELTSYAHVITATEGYKSATIGLTGDQMDLEEWFTDGLNRDIKAINSDGDIIWQGFVNRVTLALGGRSVDRGPMVDIVNRLRVNYTPQDITVSPPVSGNATSTAFLTDSGSILKYGTWSDVFNAGDCTDANALVIAASLLGDRKDPEVTETLTYGGTGLSVTLECLGYGAYLSAYFTSNPSTALGNVSDKIIAAIAASPNAVFSSDYSKVSTNTLQVPLVESGKMRAFESIKGELVKGEVSGNRFTFGVYSSRTDESQIVYAPVPSEFAYKYSLAEGIMTEYNSEMIVAPWNALPARWLLYQDFLVGRSTVNGADIRDDPRAMFIESVSYAAPYGLTLNGSKTGRSAQTLARMGIGGI